MPTAFVRKLEHGAHLSPADREAIERSVIETRQVAAHEDLVREGDRPDHVHVVLDGFACRYKLLPDGGRQIMAWMVPGDFCDLPGAILGLMDHNIATLSASRIAFIPRATVMALIEVSPALTRALWWVTLVDEAVLREWLVNMGRRPADRQIAHLFCELLVRLQAVGLASENTLHLPLTQLEMADTLGLTSVHVNRVVQQLRDQGLISWRGKTLTLHDVPALKTFASFDPNYLHLGEPADRSV